MKNIQSLLNLSAKLMLHPERATQADLDKAEALIQKPLGFGSQVDKLLNRLEEQEDTRNTASGLEKLEKPCEWDVLPPPVLTPPKRRGRPNLKKQRQQARKEARLDREAERQAKPKRPAGRPKARRAYDATGRRESGCGGQLGPGEGYCVGCRSGRRIVGAEAFTARNGRGGIKGECVVCGRGLYRMGLKDLVAP